MPRVNPLFAAIKLRSTEQPASSIVDAEACIVILSIERRQQQVSH